MEYLKLFFRYIVLGRSVESLQAKISQTNTLDAMEYFELLDNYDGHCFGFSVLEGLYSLKIPLTEEEKKLFEVTMKPVNDTDNHRQEHFIKRRDRSGGEKANDSDKFKLGSHSLVTKNFDKAQLHYKVFLKQLNKFKKENPNQQELCDQLATKINFNITREAQYQDVLKLLQKEYKTRNVLLKEIIKTGPYLLEEKYLWPKSIVFGYKRYTLRHLPLKKISVCENLSLLTNIESGKIKIILEQALHAYSTGKHDVKSFQAYCSKVFYTENPFEKNYINYLTNIFLKAQIIYSFANYLGNAQKNQKDVLKSIHHLTNIFQDRFLKEGSGYRLKNIIYLYKFSWQSLSKFLQNLVQNVPLDRDGFCLLSANKHCCYLSYSKDNNSLIYWDPNESSKRIFKSTQFDLLAQNIFFSFKSVDLKESAHKKKLQIQFEFIDYRLSQQIEDFLWTQEIEMSDKMFYTYLRLRAVVCLHKFFKSFTKEESIQFLNSLDVRRFNIYVGFLIRKQESEILKLLLDSGAEPNFTDLETQPALKKALLEKNKSIIDLLIEAKATIIEPEEFQFLRTIEIGHEKLFQLLLNNYLKKFPHSTPFENTIFFKNIIIELSRRNMTNFLKEILKIPFDVDKSERLSQALLFELVENEVFFKNFFTLPLNEEVFSTQKERANQKSFLHQPLLMHAKNLQVKKIILEHGANPNTKDIYRNTPLSLALDNFEISTLSLLLQFQVQWVQKDWDKFFEKCSQVLLGTMSMEKIKKDLSPLLDTLIIYERTDVLELLMEFKTKLEDSKELLTFVKEYITSKAAEQNKENVFEWIDFKGLEQHQKTSKQEGGLTFNEKLNKPDKLIEFNQRESDQSLDAKKSSPYKKREN